MADSSSSMPAATPIAGLTAEEVLTLLAAPLTWRRAVLLGVMIVAFALLFPVPGVRQFFALELPSRSLWVVVRRRTATSGSHQGSWRSYAGEVEPDHPSEDQPD